ncbi:Endonuclease/exonuclease/phosphatase [Corchorus olitorius]|uniref:Endonuclease/exonuclease/phosphatase n=1 Tax=Corchorus olitorius TaxID=93759 RepID=A0A1R3HSM0_9ROSI|nr:Endonuclease/exonuclease/phosphatase [Corchorus olitorius]
MFSKNPDLRDEAIRRDKKKYKKRRAEANPEVVGESPVAKQSVDGGISTSSVPLDTSCVTYRDRLTGVSPNLDSWEDWSIGDDEEDAPSHVEGSSDVGFGPRMIVQRKGRRLVKDLQGKDKAKADGEGSDSRIRSNAVIGASRDSRNRYNPLNGAPLDSGDKAKEPLLKVVNKSFKEVKSAAKPEWIPKKEGGFKIGSKSVVKKGQKDKKKVDDCALFSNSFLDRIRASSSFEPTSRVDPPPGFCFKVGFSKPIIFDPKKLADFINTPSYVALPNEVISVGDVNSQTPTTAENPGGEAVKSLMTDPLSLPQQHPPSSLGLQHNGDSDMVIDKDDNLSKEELVVEPSCSALQPRMSDAKADRIIRSLRFDGFTKVDAVGFSGGIWVLWKSSIGSVNVVEKGGQFFSIFITDNKGLRWALTVVYASPTPSVRDFLWNYLNEFDEFDNIPWLLHGDFNQVLTVEEKSGGRPEPVRRMESFREVIDQQHLIDLEASGCKFTWSNKQPPEYLIKKKLDRALCNVHWRHCFSDAFVRNLPRAHSDHCPVAISLYGLVSTNLSARPFRFEAAWQSHESFPMVLLDAWNSSDSLTYSLSHLRMVLDDWNKNKFENIHRKKRFLLARLGGVQHALESRPNPFLYRLEKELSDEFNLVLSQEEMGGWGLDL